MSKRSERRQLNKRIHELKMMTDPGYAAKQRATQRNVVGCRRALSKLILLGAIACLLIQNVRSAREINKLGQAIENLEKSIDELNKKQYEYYR